MGRHDTAGIVRIYVPLYLVDQHAREDADENTDDRNPEESPQARVEHTVDDVAVLRAGKNIVHSS